MYVIRPARLSLDCRGKSISQPQNEKPTLAMPRSSSLIDDAPEGAEEFWDAMDFVEDDQAILILPLWRVDLSKLDPKSPKFKSNMKFESPAYTVGYTIVTKTVGRAQTIPLISDGREVMDDSITFLPRRRMPHSTDEILVTCNYLCRHKTVSG